MILLNDLKAKGLFKTRVHLSDAFPAKEDKELRKVYDGVYIDIREMNKQEAMTLQGEESRIDTLSELLPKCIVDHNVMKTDQEKASVDEVMELISSSANLYTFVIEQWGNESPLARRSALKLGKPQEVS